MDGAHSFAPLDFRAPYLGCNYFGTSLHKWLPAPPGGRRPDGDRHPPGVRGAVPPIKSPRRVWPFGGEVVTWAATNPLGLPPVPQQKVAFHGHPPRPHL